MHTFVANGPYAMNGSVEISGAEAHHCLQVTRHQTGDTIRLIDLNGHWAVGVIRDATSKQVTVTVTACATDSATPAITLLVSPPKTRDRLELLLEKSVELGVEAIGLIYTHHSERREVRLEKLTDQLIAALKQCGGATLPRLFEGTFKEMVQAWPHHAKFIAHCWDDLERKPITTVKATAPLVYWVGPEGDFSKDEVHTAIQAGFAPIHLGDRILRTETAAIAGLAILRSKL